MSTENEPRLRTSGYLSWVEEIWYGLSHPLYDVMAWWSFLPLGGETACRQEFARWFRLVPGQRVASLCCGSGSTEQAVLSVAPSVEITGIDLGAGQIARARRKDPEGRIDFRVGDASSTGLEGASFDRVLITLALHEMPRDARLAVVCEARRLCKPDGLVIAIEHGRPVGLVSRLLRGFWWFAWVPGNPEVATTRDLQKRGLANEMREVELDVVDRHTSRLDWIEGVVARPSAE
jgi:ubiquinone/menaquinone biosynthesis C-methylase UbiE